MTEHCLFFVSMFILSCHFADIAEDESEITAILDLHGNRGGFAVYLGENNGDVVIELSECSNYSVHGLLRSTEAVENTRQRLMSAASYGKSHVEQWNSGEFPYIANLVSLFICENPEVVAQEEVLRVLSPDGLAFFRDGTGWRTVRKLISSKTDEWPQHFYDAGNNPVSHDAVVVPPRHLQWRGSPRWGRFHE